MLVKLVAGIGVGGVFWIDRLVVLVGLVRLVEVLGVMGAIEMFWITGVVGLVEWVGWGEWIEFLGVGGGAGAFCIGGLAAVIANGCGGGARTPETINEEERRRGVGLADRLRLGRSSCFGRFAQASQYAFRQTIVAQLSQVLRFD